MPFASEWKPAIFAELCSRQLSINAKQRAAIREKPSMTAQIMEPLMNISAHGCFF